MQLNDLRPAEGSRKNRKRIGRGNSSGHGTTAGRGTKGQLSRSGGGKGKGFEGGQQPLAMRLPKFPAPVAARARASRVASSRSRCASPSSPASSTTTASSTLP